MTNDSDMQLIDQTIKGNPRAFDELVVRYQDRLVHSLEHTLGSREDALDIAQQAFVLAWRKLSSFRREAQFYSWLYRIARNVAISRSRRHQVSSGSLDQMLDGTAFEPADDRNGAAPESAMEQAEQIRLVQQALKRVSEEFRQPLVLKEIDGFSYEEIAEILEIPLGTVRSRIFRARQEMIDILRRNMKLSAD
ncbi:MAG: sigma-70 family RNA polymerase sigma factor [Planctomycetota bacterium]